jgi:hypothetical protein
MSVISEPAEQKTKTDIYFLHLLSYGELLIWRSRTKDRIYQKSLKKHVSYPPVSCRNTSSSSLARVEMSTTA